MMPAVGAVVTWLLLAMSLRGATAECTACEDGSRQTEAPDKVINFPGFGSRTCAEIAGFATFLPSSGDQCAALQSLGSLCGCPIAENACRLCGRGDDDGNVLTVSRPSLALEGVFFSDFISSSAGPESPEPINCETLQAVLHTHGQDSDLCLSSQDGYAELCGCQGPDGVDQGETNSSSRAKHDNITTPPPSPQDSISAPQPAFSQCSLCPDGSQTEILNKTLDFGDSFPAENCIELAGLAGLLPADTGDCRQLQFFGTYCGCPIPEGTCTVCANGDPILYPALELNWFSDDSSLYSAFGSAERIHVDGFNCDLLQSSMHAVGLWENFDSFGSGALCLITQLKSSICGCEPPRYAVAVVWCYRAAAMLSLLGSTLILYDILSRPKKMSSTYHQLIIGICCFDLVSSTAYALSGVLNPRSEGFYSARGNESTCKFQSFMIQLGVMVSMSYNIFLSLYYLFVVKYNWKEFRFQKYRRYVHAAVIIYGFIMAFAAFPFYGEQGVVCYIVSAPRAESELPVTFFYTVPLSIAVVLITAASVAVCWTVYKQERKGLQWSLRQKKTMKLTKKVVKQSLFYAASFYVTIPLTIMAYYIDYHSERHYALTLGVSAISAGQGFLNALVYFYRRGDNRFCSCVLRVVKSIRGSLVWKRSTETTLKSNAGAAAAGNDTRTSTTKEQSENVAASPEGEEEEHDDSPNVDEYERVSESNPISRLDLAIDQASREEMSAEPGVVDDVGADTSRFDAAAEHWLLTQDDGQLNLPTRFSGGLGNVFQYQEPVGEGQHGMNRA